MPRLIVRSLTGCHECSYDRSKDATSTRTIGHRMPRLLVRSVAEGNGRLIVPSVADRTRLIVHRSLIATTSRTISYDGSCHRYSPIVRDSVTSCRDRSRYATAAGDRSQNYRSVAPWPNRNQSYDPEIVRSGVTVALETYICGSSNRGSTNSSLTSRDSEYVANIYAAYRNATQRTALQRTAVQRTAAYRNATQRNGNVGTVYA